MSRTVRVPIAVGLGMLCACPRTDPSADDADPASAPAATAPAPSKTTPAAPKGRTWTFDSTAAGSLPSGFRTEQTGASDTPATWAVIEDPTAPSPRGALALTHTENAGQIYNLIVVEGGQHLDLDLSVGLRAISGTQDQGGGVAWRIVDTDNYYVARWNPLENNARFYKVVDGFRSPLAAADVELDPKAWHQLRVVAEGRTMALFVDDQPVLRITDGTFTAPGAIGLWTKADAATAFDDLALAPP